MRIYFRSLFRFFLAKIKVQVCYTGINCHPQNMGKSTTGEDIRILHEVPYKCLGRYNYFVARSKCHIFLRSCWVYVFSDLCPENDLKIFQDGRIILNPAAFHSCQSVTLILQLPEGRWDGERESTESPWANSLLIPLNIHSFPSSCPQESCRWQEYQQTQLTLPPTMPSLQV